MMERIALKGIFGGARNMIRINKPSTMTILLVLLVGYSLCILPSHAQAQTSYIIVHCHNPEGKEINSITWIGNTGILAEIFDGDVSIGYGAQDVASHNQPIQISSGSHTIKVKFNGITMEQSINLSEGETQVLTFTFTRVDMTEELFTETYSNAKSILTPPSPYYLWGDENKFRGSVVSAPMVQTSSIGIINYLLTCNLTPTGIDINLSGNASITPFNSNNYIYEFFMDLMNYAGWWEYYMGNYFGSWHHCTMYFSKNILSRTDFSNWFSQYNGENNGCYLYLLDDIDNHPYALNNYVIPISTIKNYNNLVIYLNAYEIPDRQIYEYPINVGYIEREVSLTQNFSHKFSSVPYDLLGTGVGEEVNHPPVASFTYSPEDPFLGEEMTFDASSSYDPDGGEITAYTWDFGDGNIASGEVVTHTYSEAGEYTVTLTVTDNDGLTDSILSEVNVVAHQPPVASFKSLNVIELGDLDEETFDGGHMVGGVIRFDPTESYDPDGEIIKYEWDFNNGIKFTTDVPNIYDIKFKKSKVYNVTLIVTDNDGLTNTFVETLDLTLKEGDLIFIRTKIYSTFFSLVGNEYTHVGMYIGGKWMIESIYSGNSRSGGRKGVVKTPLTGWSYPSETYATLVRVITANDKIRKQAIAFAKSKLGQGYDIFVNKKSVDQRNYYCSELIWAAYYKASKGKINLGNKKKGGVWPDDIIFDTVNTQIIGYHWEHYPQ
jgi:PKD repeat protein